MKKQLIACAAFALLTACSGSKTTTAEADKFDYTVEQFADLQILRYRVPGFENLSLQQKELVYKRQLMAFTTIMALRSSCLVLLPNFSKRLC